MEGGRRGAAAGRAAGAAGPPGPAPAGWAERFGPGAPGELAGNRRKVADLEAWLRGQKEGGGGGGGRVMVLTGPPGVGKSTAVRVLARALGLDLLDWAPPLPTVWQEHQLQRELGLPYASKLDHFKAFLERAGRLAGLRLSAVGPAAGAGGGRGAGPPRGEAPGRVLLVDDLPHAHNPEARRRLVALLEELALTARLPCVLVLTDGSHGGLDDAKSLHLAILEAVEHAGAAHLAFLAVPPTEVAKALNHAAQRAGFALELADMDAVVEAADGDLRSAVTMFEALCKGGHVEAGYKGKAKRKRAPKGEAKGKGKGKKQAPRLKHHAAAARDHTLTLFHALGKFLYNKRVEDTVQESHPRHAFRLRPELERELMDCGDPEEVMAASHVGAAGVAAFVHENHLDFVHPHHVEDAAAFLAYLSDAAVLQAARALEPDAGREADAVTLEDEGAPRVCELAAASVAVRGFMFCNAHPPAARRWLPLRGPLGNQCEKGRAANRVELRNAKFRAGLGVLRDAGPAAHPAYAAMSAEAFARSALPALAAMGRAEALPRALQTLDRGGGGKVGFKAAAVGAACGAAGAGRLFRSRQRRVGIRQWRRSAETLFCGGGRSCRTYRWWA